MGSSGVRFSDELEAAHGVHHIGHQGDVGRSAAEVFLDGSTDLCLVVYQQSDAAIQAVDTRRQCYRSLGLESTALVIEYGE